MSASPFHLGWFMSGFRVLGWQDQWIGSQATTSMRADFYVDFARNLERACFDFFLSADSSYVPDAWEGKHDWALTNAEAVPKQDPAPMMAVIGHLTSNIGIAPTLSVTEYPPYLLARLISTLDHISSGRVAWNSVTSSSDRAAQNYGHPAQPPHDIRYEMAHEFTEVVTGLWDTWEPGSMPMDQKAGVFADPTKVHTLDFEGKYYRSRGPLNTGRSPQGRPVIIQAGGSPAGRDYGARFAEVILSAAKGVDEMKAYRNDIRARLVAYGRKPDDCKVMFLCAPVLGDTREAAEIKRNQMLARAAADYTYALAHMGYNTNIDFSVYDPDVPIRDLADQFSTNGHQSSLESFITSNRDRTLRELGSMAADGGATGGFIGTPDDVAAQMDEMMQEVGGDGFLIRYDTVSRRSIAEITDGLVPALQRRGLVRRGYSYSTLRDNLLEF
ncbi:NtaA/DmoA family FMN-dependent monooxygenase [Mycobacterium sp. SMC-4]|uniref:NtaA/DmoA family FMN-dependent monooxygenase n=1 Tax=Mycobacterium sp. SMC-4 TaxID=2857059 RepID=UPI003CFC12DD